MTQQEELSGVVDRHLFQSDDKTFAVLVLTIGSSTAIAKGQLGHINPGEHVTLKGSWAFHPKFGKQFDATSCAAQIPTSIMGLKKYLGSGLIRGIGPAYAERLVNHFGTQVLEVIDKSPQLLNQVPGIGQQRVQKIVEAWKDQRDISAIMVFLHDKGVSTAYATKIYKRYGNQSIQLVQENPYRLADEVWGIGFKVADQIAQKLGFGCDSPKRISAGIIFTLGSAVNLGHIYVELQELRKQAQKILELESHQDAGVLLNAALQELNDRAKIIVIKEDDSYFVALAPYHAAEKWSAYKISMMLKRQSKHAFNLDAIYKELNNEKSKNNILLNEDQQRGILAALQHKVTVITGGPGTGKTTLIKSLLRVLDSHKLTYRLAAPTGRAAKRLIESTGCHAMTIHRLLEFEPATRSFVHNEQNALKLDVLIIDEASMLDIFLMHSVLKALPLDARIILVGDIDQLPSVGAGNVLKDLIASGVVPCTKLQHIFRQAHDSLIIVNAHRVNSGEFPVSFLPDAKRDFIYIKEDVPENVPAHLQKIFETTLNSYGIKKEDAMVLVPMNRGIVGTHNLNQELQKILNNFDQKPQFVYQGVTFRQGDRVMQIKNNYDKLVFNGDIGFIHTFNHDDRVLEVSYAERIVEYEYEEFDELVLAYAISVHKSQGSEYAAAIIPIFMQHFTLLQRNLIYTAITRAKKLCILIGQPRAIAMGVKNNKGTVRKTFLQQFLTADFNEHD